MIKHLEEFKKLDSFFVGVIRSEILTPASLRRWIRKDSLLCVWMMIWKRKQSIKKQSSARSNYPLQREKR